VLAHKQFELAESKYLDGRPLTAAERRCMVVNLDSSEIRTACIACGALLRDKRIAESQKQLARKSLDKLCTRLASDEEPNKTELSITLLLVPFAEITRPNVRKFIYKLVESPRFTLRANSIPLLERLAMRGDQKAWALLEAKTEDSHVVVSKSAKFTLNRLRNEK
jgi:hypothetical protein